MSDDTPKHCLWCEHLLLVGGCRGYSEYTPSAVAEWTCSMRHDLSSFGSDLAYEGSVLRVKERLDCPDFKKGDPR